MSIDSEYTSEAGVGAIDLLISGATNTPVNGSVARRTLSSVHTQFPLSMGVDAHDISNNLRSKFSKHSVLPTMNNISNIIDNHPGRLYKWFTCHRGNDNSQ